MTKQASRAGFTLIELMVVVIIIAALAGMVLPRVLPASDEAKVNIAKGDMAGISVALKMYRLRNDRYPSDSEGLNVLMQSGSGGPYLERAPKDPWGVTYAYHFIGDDVVPPYDLYSVGRDGKDKTQDDVNHWDDRR